MVTFLMTVIAVELVTQGFAVHTNPRLAAVRVVAQAGVRSAHAPWFSERNAVPAARLWPCCYRLRSQRLSRL